MISNLLYKLLGQDNDKDNFTKLAPLIIFFVIWLVGAIVKAVQKSKAGTQQPEKPTKPREKQEPSFEELAKKIQQKYARAKEEARRAAQEREIEEAKPPIGRIEPKPVIQIKPQPQQEIAAKPAVATYESPTIRVLKNLESPEAPVTVERPVLENVEPIFEKAEGLTPEGATVSTEPEIIHHEYLRELIGQYSTTDGFRKAILSYEILGKPVGMREFENF